MTASAACPVCERAAGEPFVEMLGLPVYCNVLWPSRQEAVAAPRGDIRLHFCHACGMIWNAAFDPGLVRYAVGYENSLHFSAVFQAYAEALADRLVERYGLRGKTIVEIGSGQGEFLALLCQDGRNRGIGFDPSYDGEVDAAGEGLRFVRDVYSDRHRNVRPDFVCCRHVLEHVEEPRRFISDLRAALGDREDVVAYFEVPAAEYLFGHMSVWDVIYEHCSIFSAPSLRRLFEQAGFRVLDFGFSFGGQYLWLEAAPAIAADAGVWDAAAIDELGTLAGRFARACSRSVERWSDTVAELGGRGGLALWGAGSKGVTFLNIVGSNGIAHVVDVNPRKHGRHVPGTGDTVAAPSDLAPGAASTVLVMNPLYREEVERALAALSIEAEVLVA